MYLLDTNIISELRKASSNKAHPNVLAWASEQEASSLYQITSKTSSFRWRM